MNKAFEALFKQLSLDYCVTFEEAADKENHFKTFIPLEGRRQFRTLDDCVLKVAAVNGKLLFTGKEEIIEQCGKRYETTIGDWFMDVKNFKALEDIVSPFGFRLCSAHPFYLPGSVEIEADPLDGKRDYEIVKYDREAIEQFRGNDRFSNAYSFEEKAPDMLGVGAVLDGKIIGMAGASADSETLWQIGIDVVPEARGKHVGADLVRILKNDILKSGHMPFYGTSMSNIGSQRVAHHAGFVASWSELGAEKITED